MIDDIDSLNSRFNYFLSRFAEKYKAVKSANTNIKMYQNRFYRNLVQKSNLIAFRIAVKETDLMVHTTTNLEKITTELVLKYRSYIETYINNYPDFLLSLIPVTINHPAPLIIRNMAEASQNAGVGPMASVAGAIAESVGNALLSFTDEVIVENGGDIFIKTKGNVTVGIFAGKSPLSLKIGIRITSSNKTMSVCTSSGTVGHSVSMGKADAICVLSESCSLADAAATSIGNLIKTANDIQQGIDFGKKIKGVKGIVIIIGKKIGFWGDIEIVAV